jgi:hypothetical protein
MGFGVSPTYLALLPRLRGPVLCALFVPNYRCGAAPECTPSERGHRVPFSARSMDVGAGTENGHKILWFAECVNTISILLPSFNARSARTQSTSRPGSQR